MGGQELASGSISQARVQCVARCSREGAVLTAKLRPAQPRAHTPM